MRSFPLWCLNAGAVAATGLIVAAVRPFYADAPPPAHTGGFGEPTCHDCHRGAEMNYGSITLRLDSLPPAYEPKRSYRLTLVLSRPEMQMGGFQLAARLDVQNGKRRLGGLIVPLDRRSVISKTFQGAGRYLQHSRAGTALTAPDTARWTFEWRAPADGRVVFHVAANAANGDNSEGGDWIYTREFRVSRRP